jgi:AcrR family transcriptional regulator
MIETAAKTTAREGAESALLDAAERLLVRVGYAGVTTRRLADEAGVNHGLVHYYFGSLENVLVRVLERFTARLTARQRALYAQEIPFAEKWRLAMRYLDDDREYQKVWLELQALAWNRPDLRDRIRRVTEEWRGILVEGLEQARAEHGVDVPVEVLAALVATFNQGIMLERSIGVDGSHGELLAWIERWLDDRT